MRLIRIMVCVVLLTLAAAGSALGADAPDFRNVLWGMTMEEVMAAETEAALTVLADQPVLVGDCIVAGRKARLFYQFASSHLREAFYAFEDAHTNRNLYIDDFEDLRELLALKYGEPLIDTAIWKRNLYRNDPDEWGRAVVIGDVTFRAEWETPRTRIILSLGGDNYEARHFLGYVSKVTPSAGPDLRGL